MASHVFTMVSTVGGIVGLGGIVGNALQLGVNEQYKVLGIQVLDVRVYHMRLSVQLVNFSLFWLTQALDTVDSILTLETPVQVSNEVQKQLVSISEKYNTLSAVAHAKVINYWHCKSCIGVRFFLLRQCTLHLSGIELCINMHVGKHSSSFYAPAWKVRRGHIVIGSSVHPFVCLSVCLSIIPSGFQTKCNI